jgi:type II secretory pathway component GspD/PulD (secretin)
LNNYINNNKTQTKTFPTTLQRIKNHKSNKTKTKNNEAIVTKADKGNNEAIVTKADKGNSLVILSLKDYNEKVQNFINTNHLKKN